MVPVFLSTGIIPSNKAPVKTSKLSKRPILVEVIEKKLLWLIGLWSYVQSFRYKKQQLSVRNTVQSLEY